jgi:hypothetical protein
MIDESTPGRRVLLDEMLHAEHGAALALRDRRRKPCACWEAVLAEMAQRGAAANGERAEVAKRLAKE